MATSRLLERFLRYVRMDTTARENAGRYPSSPGQMELGKMLAGELRGMGAADVEQDSHGLVWAMLPATVAGAATIALNAHLDTSPETTGANVRPQVIRDYAGGDIVLPGDKSKVIRVGENPELDELRGRTLITTDGTTLLGADDKAGVAVIMEAAQRWLEQPSARRAIIRILFTCDEEIGHGVDYVDLAKLGAVVGYTLDGSASGEIDVETFSADLALVTFHGVNIHPSIAKGRMVNAVKLSADFLHRLAAAASPETTRDREGFVHPYVITGGVAETTIRVLLRDFDTGRLAHWADVVRRCAVEAAAPFANVRDVKANVDIQPQYRNMGEGLAREPRAVAYAEEAMRRAGLAPKRTIVRGGTDGSRFTELGLPTPNLSTGEHNPHSPLEWTCLEEMEQAVATLLALGEIWGERSAG
jgi:tripeptide aminopeptidase